MVLLPQHKIDFKESIMPKYKTGSQFDEFFMNAFQFQQSLNEKRATRTQDINFRLRQLSLLDDYRQGLIENYERSSNLRGEEELGRYRRQGFTDTKEGQTPDVNVLGQGLTSPVIEPEQEGIERTITKNINGKPVIFGVTDSGGLIDLGEKYYQPKTSKGNTKPLELTEKYQTDAFNRLKNPSEYEDQIQSFFGGGQANTPGKDFGTVAGKLLDNSTEQWLDTVIRRMGGYPTTEQLTNAITEAAGNGKLNEKQIEQLLNFMDSYSQFQGNMDQPPKIELKRNK